MWLLLLLLRAAYAQFPTTLRLEKVSFLNIAIIFTTQYLLTLNHHFDHITSRFVTFLLLPMIICHQPQAVVETGDSEMCQVFALDASRRFSKAR